MENFLHLDTNISTIHSDILQYLLNKLSRFAQRNHNLKRKLMQSRLAIIGTFATVSRGFIIVNVQRFIWNNIFFKMHNLVFNPQVGEFHICCVIPRIRQVKLGFIKYDCFGVFFRHNHNSVDKDLVHPLTIQQFLLNGNVVHLMMIRGYLIKVFLIVEEVINTSCEMKITIVMIRVYLAFVHA